jgi:hypothetical protein
LTTNEYLKSIGACQAAVDQIGDRKFKDAVRDASRADWLFWLVGTNAGREGWPTREETVDALDKALTSVGASNVWTERDSILALDANGFTKKLTDVVMKAANSAAPKLEAGPLAGTKLAPHVSGTGMCMERLATMAESLKKSVSFAFLDTLDL